MKKVVLTFEISDEVANNIDNDLFWGRYDNVVTTLMENEDAEVTHHIYDVNEDGEERGIWMRLGANVRASKDQMDKILSGDNDALRQALIKGTFTPSGDTYIPDCEIEYYNDEYGTDYPIQNIEFNV